MTSPTQKSLELIRKEGFTAQVVEHWNSFARCRQDLFGFIDIVAVSAEYTGVAGVQTTSKKNMGARILKIKKDPVSKVWIAGGNRLFVHGWEKLKNGRYELTKYEITPENIFLVDK